MAKKQRSQKLKTVAALQIALGVGHATVHTWIKRQDWPFSRKPPWKYTEVPAMLKWAGRDGKPNPVPASAEPVKDTGGGGGGLSLRQQKLRGEIRKIRAQAEAAEVALAREKGELLDAADVSRTWANIAAVVRNGMESLPPTLSSYAQSLGMPNTAATEFVGKCKAAINQVLQHLAERADEDEDQ